MLSIIIVEAFFESRDAGTADVAGAYKKAYMDDEVVIMNFVGASVSLW